MSTTGRIVWLLFLGVLAFVALGCVYGEVAFSPDGKRIAAVVPDERPPPADAEDQQATVKTWELWVTDLESGEHTFVSGGKSIGMAPTWSRDGRYLWFLGGRGNDGFELVRWDGSEKRAVAQGILRGDVVVALLWPPQPLPDGSAILFTETLEEPTDDGPRKLSRVMRWDVESESSVELARHAAGAVVSPDGKSVAFLAWAPDDHDGQRPSLCIQAVEGGGERRVVARLREKLNDVGIFPPRWSPDGRRLAWVDAAQPQRWKDQMAVYVANVAEGGLVRCVSLEGTSSTSPVWSADGESLFFAARTEASPLPSTWRVSLPGGDTEPVPGGEGCVPAGLAPNGRTLALRRGFEKPGGSLDEVSVVRLLDLRTRRYRDDWITAAQRRALLRSEIASAERHVTEAAAAVARAEQALAAMREELPEGAEVAEDASLRERLRRLRKLSLESAEKPSHDTDER